MTKKQRARVLKIIRGDCQTTDILLNDNGRTCAIGALALACRIPKKRLLNSGSLSWGDMQRLENSYGLTMVQQDEIINANDKRNTVAARRKAVTAYVKSLPLDE